MLWMFGWLALCLSDWFICLTGWLAVCFSVCLSVCLAGFDWPSVWLAVDLGGWG